ncbi:MAG: methyltransferase domain-containing protein [bacterium]|nr:methyltransferase domain-containing protein [bacterium]
MVCRNGRVIRPELLGGSDSEAVVRNLADLERINRLFGAHRVIGSLLSGLVGPRDTFSLLDVGAGSGDMATSVQACYPHVRTVSLDLRSSHLRSAPDPRVSADAFRLPFPDGAFDIVLSCLLLHEHSNERVRVLLESLYRVAGRALVVLELHRHPLAYRFLPATSWLFGWSMLTLHDGPISVEAAFVPEELRHLASAAGLSQVKVRRHFPWFRLSLVARR